MATDDQSPGARRIGHRGDARAVAQEGRRRGRRRRAARRASRPTRSRVEVPAPAAGVLAEIAVKEGDDGRASARVLGTIDDGAARGRRAARPRPRQAPAPAEPAAPRRAGAAAGADAGGEAGRQSAAVARPCASSLPRTSVDAAGDRRHRQGRPRHQGRRARRRRAPGGPAPRRAGGAARRAAPAALAPAPAGDAAREERVRMTRLRQTIAQRLKEAQNTAAMLTTFNEVDMTRGDGAARPATRTCSRRSTASGSASWASS